MPRIAIPVPHSIDHDYAQRALPQYEQAVRMAGGEPLRIQLDSGPSVVNAQLEECNGIILPGSKADVDPARYGKMRHPSTADADGGRDSVDEMLLLHADEYRKPVLGICYGLQILNVHRKGTLLQHIESPIKHDAGRAVPMAHEVEVDRASRLAQVLGSSHSLRIPVNSSHHQSAEVIGEGLRAVARCPDDGVIEAIEGTSREHFVLAVQWHPERSVDESGTLGEAARSIFRSFVAAAGRQRG